MKTSNTWDSKPTFTFAYAECPHEYFTFDADGNRIAKEDETNWKDKSIYLNQYKYITKCMERIVEDIQKNDPSACFHRLCSLEGALHGVRKIMLPDEVKADLQEFYNEHTKR